MLRQTLKGTGVALVTPFKKDKSIDFAALENLIDIQIAGGLDYLVTLGTTGESVVLSDEEKIEVFNCTVNKVNGRVPIVIGIGGNVQVLFTFDYWTEGEEQMSQVWDVVLRSLRLGLFIPDPTRGQVVNPNLN